MTVPPAVICAARVQDAVCGAGRGESMGEGVSRVMWWRGEGGEVVEVVWWKVSTPSPPWRSFGTFV